MEEDEDCTSCTSLFTLLPQFHLLSVGRSRGREPSGHGVCSFVPVDKIQYVKSVSLNFAAGVVFLLKASQELSAGSYSM